MEQADKELLSQVFGFKEFKLGQQLAIETLLAGHSCLAIFPTGSGKSLCYQYTALKLPHLTLVVSPLLALMQDQLDFLHSKGIAAAKIDSTLSYDQVRDIMAQVKADQLKILMVSVERFKNERFRQFIQAVKVSLLVVDEAHCISEWGHNFRPDYLKLPDHQRTLGIPQALLLTATATPAVKQDMAQKFAINDEHVVQTGFYRENLHLAAESVAESEKAQRLTSLLKQFSGAGIVYVTLQKQAEELAALLRQQGINAKCYHAGLPDNQRLQVQQAFMQDTLDVVVATIAFGMGVDKANIRFVVHYELPKSIESYSQEIGRAGRDGNQADCVTLANLTNLTRLENFIFADTPEPRSIKHLLQMADNETIAEQWEVQLVPLSNQTNIRPLALKTLLVQLELRQVIEPLFGYFSSIRFRLIASQQEIEAQFSDERLTFVQAIFAHCEHKKVWSVLDQGSLQNHYPSYRSRVLDALEFMHQKQWIELQSQRHTDVYKVNQQKLTEPELATHLQQYFKQREEAEIDRIGKMVAFFQSPQCLSRQLSEYFGDTSQTQDCGHCSVCNGNIISLPKPQNNNQINSQQLHEVGTRLHHSLLSATGYGLSAELFSRFLAGMSSPYLTKIKAKTLSGFGLYESVHYRQMLKVCEVVCESVVTDDSPTPQAST
ncbi:RecQ family ATP-dependent DNA helicase [Aliiglaciecola litoralis]|uniref:ATP-dependent DNA helicase RecQ n=1 Tax=Aliiglaciecola litoralis TaxID=582857 RepID=A0ABN1LQA0_9ALTE